MIASSLDSMILSPNISLQNNIKTIINPVYYEHKYTSVLIFEVMIFGELLWIWKFALIL